MEQEELMKIGWALVAGLGRVAETLEGIREDLKDKTEDRRALSAVRAEAARKGLEKRNRNEDGTLTSKIQQNSSKTPAKPDQQNSSKHPANLQQTSSKPPAKPKGTTKGAWDAYEAAYFARHRMKPPRNPKVNTIMVRLVQYVGEEDARALAKFYPTTTHALYVQAKHPVELLLRDYQKLLVELKTGARTTQDQAKKEEKHSTIDDAFERVRNQGTEVVF